MGYKVYLHNQMTLKQCKTDLIHVIDANANVDMTYSKLQNILNYLLPHFLFTCVTHASFLERKAWLQI